ncbi:MAG: VTT domain-containing protein [Bdellovibrionota bacterium]
MSFSIDILQAVSLLNDPIALIKTVGLIGLIIIIFAETGLLFGFFLPGDSLLVTAGLLAANGTMSLENLLVALSVAAVVGDAVGFYIGSRLGAKLYAKKDSFFFRRKHLNYAHDFYMRHGGKTIIFARFIPIVRTFAPTVAGAAQMNYFRFSLFNVFGGIGWVVSMLLAGFYLGKIFGEQIQNYVHVLIVGIIFLSCLPLIYKFVKFRKKK